MKLIRPTGETTVIPGTVSWAKVGSVVGDKVQYLVAVIFNEPIADLAAATGIALSETELEARLVAAPSAGERGPDAPTDTEGPPAAPEEPATRVNVAGSNVAWFPGTTSKTAAADPDDALLDREIPLDELAAPLPAQESVDGLRGQLDDATAQLAELSATKQLLLAEIDRSSKELIGLLSGWDAERRRWREERAQLAKEAADALVRADALEDSLKAREHERTLALAGLQERYEARIAELVQAAHDRDIDFGRVVTEQARLEEERATLAEAAATAQARADALQAALDAQEQEHAEALAEQRRRHEELIAELVRTANDQQEEYQSLLSERAAARDEERSRAERTEAELARERAAAEQLRVEFENSAAELRKQLGTAQALSAAHEARYATVVRRAETLLAQLTAPVRPDEAEVPRSDGEAQETQAVA